MSTTSPTGSQMKNSVLKEEWLASSAVVSLGGVFLLARALQLPADEREVFLFIVTIPGIPDIVGIVIAVALFVSAAFLALASVIPSLRTWPLRGFTLFSPLLWFFIWVAFTVSWLSEIGELTEDRWWWKPLVWGGLVMSFFILYRLFRAMHQLVAGSRPKNDAKSGNSNDVEPGEPPERTGSHTPSQSPKFRSIWIAATAVVAIIVVARIATRPRAQ